MINLDFTVSGWRLTALSGLDQEEHAPVWVGVGGFKYNYVRPNKTVQVRGYYLFLYYGSKLVNINLEKKIKVLDTTSE